MNYLAHLHIADHTNSSLLGNFLGDFVKGSPEGKYSVPVVQGIRLHRFVDSFTDQHAIVKSLKQYFPTELRRFAPITLDMFWDHCLAKNWPVYHQSALMDFCQQAERQIAIEMQQENYSLPERFLSTSEAMWQGRWLEHYADIDNIIFSLQRIARRGKRMAPLASTGDTLLNHYDIFAEQFLQLYPELLQQAQILS
ncbi:ACP phosphodiesterase [Psychromonas sp. MME2]|uniref:acyl carrier protein phosphodiesterase n=1 Tax=unclassified Psychromonas TaxID=2614957 RepID=UPI00339CD45B